MKEKFGYGVAVKREDGAEYLYSRTPNVLPMISNNYDKAAGWCDWLRGTYHRDDNHRVVRVRYCEPEIVKEDE